MIVQYTDPAGNITAIVESPVDPKDRAAVASRILAERRAEQVGFEVPPRCGGHCRLEMMGGEFCGNAARSYGYLKALDWYAGGIHRILVEISGVREPVPVTVDFTTGEAAAEMPLPFGVTSAAVQGQTFPVVRSEGICHLIALREPDEAFVRLALAAMDPLGEAAMGVMFCVGDRLTPVVYVRSTGSLVWESSCGSGSLACAWYLSRGTAGEYRFLEPGGTILVRVETAEGRIIRCTMGGTVAVSPVETIEP